jgi:hypothetical protein
MSFSCLSPFSYFCEYSTNTLEKVFAHSGYCVFSQAFFGTWILEKLFHFIKFSFQSYAFRETGTLAKPCTCRVCSVFIYFLLLLIHVSWCSIEFHKENIAKRWWSCYISFGLHVGFSAGMCQQGRGRGVRLCKRILATPLQHLCLPGHREGQILQPAFIFTKMVVISFLNCSQSWLQIRLPRVRRVRPTKWRLWSAVPECAWCAPLRLQERLPAPTRQDQVIQN